MKYLKLHAGFTLVELIIVMGMTSIFVVVLTDIFVSLTATKIESESTAAVVEDGRFIMSRLAYDIERADAVVAPENLNVGTSNITSSSATITWQTAVASTSQVEYGTTTSYGTTSALDSSLVTSHSVNLTGLSSGTTYQFRVLSRDSSNNLTTSANYSFAAGTPASIAHVQSSGIANDSAANFISRAFSSNVTQGNLIVAAVGFDDPGATMSCSDTRGSSYTVATFGFDPRNAHDQSLSVCYAIAASSGANTVTASFSAGTANYRRITISEYSGVAATNSLDVTATNISTATTAANNATSTAATTTQAGDLIYGVASVDDGNTNAVAGTGFTSRHTLIDTIVEDQVQSSAGTIAATFTFPEPHDYLAQMLAFKAASLPGGALPASLGTTSNVMSLTIGGGSNQYAVVGGNLVLTNSNGSSNLNSDRTSVSDVTYQRVGNVNGAQSIKIKFTVTSRATLNQGPVSRTYETTVGSQ